MFRDNIRKLCSSRGLRMKDLADRSGMSRQGLNNALVRKKWETRELRWLFGVICLEPVVLCFSDEATGERIGTPRPELMLERRMLPLAEAGRILDMPMTRVYRRCSLGLWYRDELIDIACACSMTIEMRDMQGNVIYIFDESDRNKEE